MNKTILITVICLSLLLTLAIFLTGCTPRVIDTKYSIVEGNVIGVNHQPQWLQPMQSGKITIMIPHPERNEVVVTYDGITQTFDNKVVYDMYKDNVGGTIKIQLIEYHYSDSSIGWDIALLEEY